MTPSLGDTPLRGRADEVRRVVEELRDPGVRLVSLTGIAGVGKTRIAAAAAARVEAETDRTVAWLDVTRVPDAE
ncbi:MAG TPA: hypothetical protein DCS55_16980, partial [Acidimicrobiaceae bacterium]|nr:hypothetical protein [Acidimicrobiaceae bacterium]